MNKPSSKKVLITGSTGFIGSHVFRYFQNAGYEVFGVSRYEDNESTIKKDISGNCDWSKELEDVEIVIHCAAAVHQMKASEETLKNYEDLNITATINLAAGYTITKVDTDNYTFATSTTSSITETGGGGSVSAGPVTVTA